MQKEVNQLIDVPLANKEFLTLDEAAALTGVGINKLRSVSNAENCEFVLWIGNKRLLKRRKLVAYLEGCYSI